MVTRQGSEKVERGKEGNFEIPEADSQNISRRSLSSPSTRKIRSEGRKALHGQKERERTTDKKKSRKGAKMVNKTDV